MVVTPFEYSKPSIAVSATPLSKEGRRDECQLSSNPPQLFESSFSAFVLGALRVGITGRLTSDSVRFVAHVTFVAP